ncbi:MAG: presenilin family intramembrane aspartyl protease [Candidatus Bathyarchaeia archaeon]
MKAKFDKEIVLLTPIFASLLFGFLCAFLIKTSQTETYTITPFQEGVGSFGNAIYFIILVGVGAFLLYTLLQRKSIKIINLITRFALTTAIFMLSIIYLSATLELVAGGNMELLVLPLSLLVTATCSYAIFKTHSQFSNVVVICLGGALGAFLGVSIPTLSAIMILVFLAVYDVFAVYQGPIGKIARSGLEQLRGLSFSFKEIQMGLGDLIFYSMLSGHMLFNFGFYPCLVSIIGILLGCFTTFKMLHKKRIFPGLPFPILFGLTASFIVSILQGV